MRDIELVDYTAPARKVAFVANFERGMLALEKLLDQLADGGALFMTMEDAAREARERLSASRDRRE